MPEIRTQSAKKPVPRVPRICYDKHVTIYKKDPFRYLLAISKKCAIRHALRFGKMAVLGTTLFVVAPLQAATIETMASLSESLRAFPPVRLSNGTFYGTIF